MAVSRNISVSDHHGNPHHQQGVRNATPQLPLQMSNHGQICRTARTLMERPAFAGTLTQPFLPVYTTDADKRSLHGLQASLRSARGRFNILMLIQCGTSARSGVCASLDQGLLNQSSHHVIWQDRMICTEPDQDRPDITKALKLRNAYNVLACGLPVLMLDTDTLYGQRALPWDFQPLSQHPLLDFALYIPQRFKSCVRPPPPPPWRCIRHLPAQMQRG